LYPGSDRGALCPTGIKNEPSAFDALLLPQSVDSIDIVETGVGGLSTHHMHSESIQVNVLALKNANHHPAQGLEVSDITPEVLILTQIFMQRMIETGSRCH